MGFQPVTIESNDELLAIRRKLQVALDDIYRRLGVVDSEVVDTRSSERITTSIDVVQQSNIADLTQTLTDPVTAAEGDVIQAKINEIISALESANVLKG